MELKLIAEGFGFAEGPLWHQDGYLLVSDVIENKIVKIEEGRTEIFLQPSGLNGPKNLYHGEQIGSNGLAMLPNRHLIVCQHGNHAIAEISLTGQPKTLVDSYLGKRLNSPNDLAIGPEGSIYFTDPPYGLISQKLIPHIAQEHAGVYKWTENSLELLTIDFQFPNGICFSPDFQHLYVASNHMGEYVRRYNVHKGNIEDGIIFLKENADGLKTDMDGNLYLAQMSGILTVNSLGIRKSFIPTPEMATNLCIEGSKLYISTEHKVYVTTIS